MAEITQVRTTYAVTVNTSQVHESQTKADGASLDLASLLALVGQLAEEGLGGAVKRELLALRDHAQRVVGAQKQLGAQASVIAAGLSAVEQRAAQVERPR